MGAPSAATNPTSTVVEPKTNPSYARLMDLLLTALPAVGVIALLFALLPQFAELERAGRRRERKLDAIIKHLGIGLSPSADLPPEILEHLKAGRKIQAIKAYRLHTGAGLKEAKEVIEETLANMAAK